MGNSSHLGPAAKDAGNPRRLQSRRPASDHGPVLRPPGQRQPGGAATRAEACGLHEAKRPRRLPCAPAGAEGRSGARSGPVGVGRSQVRSGPSRAELPRAPAWPRTARLWGGACGKRAGRGGPRAFPVLNPDSGPTARPATTEHGPGLGDAEVCGQVRRQAIRVQQTHTARGQLLEASWRRQAWKNKCVLAEGKGWAGGRVWGRRGSRGAGRWGVVGSGLGRQGRDTQVVLRPRRVPVGTPDPPLDPGGHVGWGEGGVGNGWGVTPFPPGWGHFPGPGWGSCHAHCRPGREASPRVPLSPLTLCPLPPGRILGHGEGLPCFSGQGKSFGQCLEGRTGPTRQRPSFGRGSAAVMTNPTGEVVPMPPCRAWALARGPTAVFS